MIHQPDRPPDPEYADSSRLNTRHSIYGYRVSGPPFRTWVFDQLRIPPKAAILDIGSGPGSMWLEHEDRLSPGWRVHLLDRSPGMLADATASGVRAWAINSCAEQLPLRAASVDAVTAFHMLHDVDDIGRALAEIRRVLVPGGTFHATTNGPGHMVELRNALARAGVRGDYVRTPLRSRFGLSNGAEILSLSFAAVSVRVQRNTLLVPDAAPLIAYAMTIERLAEQLDPDRLYRFESLVREQIAAEGGFSLSTESGLFLAG